MDKIIFCENCQDDVEFEIRDEIIKVDLEDIVFTYGAHVPYCKKCGKEVSVPELNDLNLIKAYTAQKAALEMRAESE